MKTAMSKRGILVKKTYGAIHPKRPPYTYELLDEYIRENEYLHRIDMEKFGYNNLDLAIRKYAKKHGANIIMKNYYMWVKVPRNIKRHSPKRIREDE